mmetsp:Transcript_14121/g.33469  ORF Transcript_14121/g.33469 Transcript_14121/m.33469 type:complete len:101 (-) Transcript_14121:229-531(-)|eukprot:CAMPEP_0172600222 /NCGR_PEP_ID=MMETSP1068-20121228/20372_1 /TAXON_ID=35684 /ORGANISM="Pseudopedinella elastica, Strain CCMP716" /LENGTH=100 /DNA_ID=CAMNT_0013400777 /DNA_START=32 /DNA_END=334 /DNA_ORIENTATION=-
MSFVARLAPRVAPAVARASPATAPVKRNLGSSIAKTPSAKDIWLSDPGTYPIFVIIGGAVVFCASFYIHNLATNPDIRIAKEKRKHSVIRTWAMTPGGHH